MKPCHFLVPNPDEENWEYLVAYVFNEETCCGKPAPFMHRIEDRQLPICAEHFDFIESLERQDKFAGRPRKREHNFGDYFEH